MADFPAHARSALTEEELALLRSTELAEDGLEVAQYDEPGSPAPAGFRERLVLGDISW